MSQTAQISLFAHAQQVHLEGSPITIQYQSHRGGFNALKEATAPAAFHNSGERHEPPKCHPRTREAILKKIVSWVKGEIDTETFIFWLNGTLGVGKSAIAQTIAEICEKEGLLLASFFFARSDPTRNNAKLLVTTLAYQIALAIPPVQSHIVEVFERDPFIHTRSLETQAVKLLVEPLEHAIADQSHIPPLIAIDGLDECDDKCEQCQVLDIISRVGGAMNATSRRLVFLVASRPEQEISLKFNSTRLQDVSSQYTVNTSPDSDNDLRRFLKDGFNEIKTTHPIKSSIPASWPSTQDFEKLLQRADGQFLYCKLALSFTSNIRYRPTARLAAILHAGTEAEDNPFTALDTLYHQIFSTIANVESLLTILGLRVTLTFSDHMRDIVRWRLGMEFEDVKLLFGDLVSVVEVNEDRQYLKFRHASLQEFLTDEKRSKEYCIRVDPYHAEWVTWRLEQNVPLDDRDEMLEFFEHFILCHPSPRLQAALQVRDICSLYAQHVWEDASNVDHMYNMISLIRNMEIHDADRLYRFQLGAFKPHIMSLLRGINARPLTPFTVVLLLHTSILPLWQKSYTGVNHTNYALSCIFCGVKPHSLGHLTEEFCSFLFTMRHSDGSMPLQYALNSIRMAAVPILLHYLSRPPELTHTPPFERFLEKLKTHPWMSRMRSCVRKKPRAWCILYTCCRFCAKLYCNCRHLRRRYYDGTFWASAYISPTPPHVLFLHNSYPLLAYFYALILLPDVLAETPRSEELLKSCKTHIFHRASILFPHRTKIARSAISNYVERMEAEEHWWGEVWLD